MSVRTGSVAAALALLTALVVGGAAASRPLAQQAALAAYARHAGGKDREEKLNLRPLIGVVSQVSWGVAERGLLRPAASAVLTACGWHAARTAATAMHAAHLGCTCLPKRLLHDDRRAGQARRASLGLHFSFGSEPRAAHPLCSRRRRRWARPPPRATPTSPARTSRWWKARGRGWCPSFAT